MSTWLMDTSLFKMLATPKAKPLLEWCEANEASLFISAASLTHFAQAISKLPGSQSQRASAQFSWLDEIITHFADRIHSVDAAIATQAGVLLPRYHRPPATSVSRRLACRDSAGPWPWPDNTPRWHLWSLNANADRDRLISIAKCGLVLRYVALRTSTGVDVKQAL